MSICKSYFFTITQWNCELNALQREGCDRVKKKTTKKKQNENNG